MEMAKAATVPAAEEPPLLDVQGLRAHFFTRRGRVKAVDDVSFSVRRGEVLALVGESGSGKSIACHAIMGLMPKPAGRIVAGRILFDGEDLVAKSDREMRRYRGRRLSMILQDPMTSLNPAFTIGDQVGEAVRIHQGLRGKSLRERVLSILRSVRIPAPEMRVGDYPHQLSGGMRQRVVGAVCLSCEPDLLIADEPTTALDLTIQSQYLELLQDLQREQRFAMLFVTHDFGVVAKICDRAAVMYAGRIAEIGPVERLFDDASHPYTRALIAALPRPGSRGSRLPHIEGQPPSLLDPPEGCRFAARCPEAGERCRREAPPETVLEPDRSVWCWNRHGSAAA